MPEGHPPNVSNQPPAADAPPPTDPTSAAFDFSHTDVDDILSRYADIEYATTEMGCLFVDTLADAWMKGVGNLALERPADVAVISERLSEGSDIARKDAITLVGDIAPADPETAVRLLAKALGSIAIPSTVDLEEPIFGVIQRSMNKGALTLEQVAGLLKEYRQHRTQRTQDSQTS